ncbi:MULTISPECIES: MerR family transcriptional regulator [unclassified Streptomyces]|uniref:MerR family transcriptional regulator n=1 Tax=unclassified Streptomyces TaxID=2593676 RepID=UPI00081EBFEE|nr:MULTISPECIES: MerR family transcriptional regulator [unclassified Streptomyces]MYZ34935.1 MerR family transcriptional regulator [Streptomyces sp. SID4917]SCF71492.1 DNA-binding transcriptional regulator, MerR family [Streptomyces sp. MnatMP-M17]
MATETGRPTLTVDELAARAGVTVRTVRFYSSRGLLPPPVIGARRIGHYGPEHLSRLALIEELQRQGMTLAAIERYLEQLPPDLSARDLAIHRALVASWAPDSPENATRAELESRAGRALTEDDIDRLAAMGALARADRPDNDRPDTDRPDTDDTDSYRPDTYRLDPALLRLCVELLDVPIAQETILAARTVLLEHTREAARKLTRMFRDEVSPSYGRDASGPEQIAAVKSLSAHMEPLVVQALVTAFQRSLKEELRAAFQAAAE